jgi:translation initiation factor 3 subunit L
LPSHHPPTNLLTRSLSRIGAAHRRSAIMSLRERVPPQYQNGEAARRAPDNESDVEEEAMANDYREQVQYDGMDDLDRMPSMSNNQDIHAQLQAAATPLEFQATLETKFASYDNYCNLFHYILNSEGPVDLEVPNVRPTFAAIAV